MTDNGFDATGLSLESPRAQIEFPFALPPADSCACGKLTRVRGGRAQRQRAKGKGRYPLNWLGIANSVKESAGWRCECCGHPRKKKNAKDACGVFCVHPDDGKKRALTVHHLDMRPENCEWWNLVALCNVCHMRVQGRVDWAQMSLSDSSAAWGRYAPPLARRSPKAVSRNRPRPRRPAGFSANGGFRRRIRQSRQEDATHRRRQAPGARRRVWDSAPPSSRVRSRKRQAPPPSPRHAHLVAHRRRSGQIHYGVDAQIRRARVGSITEY